MFKNLAEFIWRSAPGALRRRYVRATNTRFTVTAAGIISNSEGQVLLLKHRFRAGSGWGIPGGFLQSNEQPDEGLRRELREEIGIELQTLKLHMVRTFKRARQLEIVFSCTTNESVMPRSEEIEAAEWFRLELLPHGLPADQRRLIKDLLNRGANLRD